MKSLHRGIEIELTQVRFACLAALFECVSGDQLHCLVLFLDSNGLNQILAKLATC
jgi:hypothetical protein